LLLFNKNGYSPIFRFLALRKELAGKAAVTARVDRPGVISITSSSSSSSSSSLFTLDTISLASVVGSLITRLDNDAEDMVMSSPSVILVVENELLPGALVAVFVAVAPLLVELLSSPRVAIARPLDLVDAPAVDIDDDDEKDDDGLVNRVIIRMPALDDDVGLIRSCIVELLDVAVTEKGSRLAALDC
jgi:hypothetical protein